MVYVGWMSLWPLIYMIYVFHTKRAEIDLATVVIEGSYHMQLPYKTGSYFYLLLNNLEQTILNITNLNINVTCVHIGQYVELVP